MKCKSLVSVIIPTHNRAKIIINTLDSVWEQTYRPLEVIVIDDGSTDDTRSVVKKWITQKKENDFFVKYIYQNNNGAPSARNRGLDNATGRYIQFLDSDDLLFPKKISKQIAVLKEENTAICICNYQYIDGEGKVIKEVSNDVSVKEIIKYFIGVSVSTPVIDTHQIKVKVRWNEKLNKLQDIDYFVRLLLIVDQISWKRETLFKYVIHKDESITKIENPEYSKILHSILNFFFLNIKQIKPSKYKPLVILVLRLIHRNFNLFSLKGILTKEIRNKRIKEL